MPVLWHVTQYCRLNGSRRGAIIFEGHIPSTEPVMTFSAYQHNDGAEGRDSLRHDVRPARCLAFCSHGLAHLRI